MLVLSRKLNESIKIGENVTITLIRVEGGKVRLGIDAPRDVRVLRSELTAHDDSKRSSKSPQIQTHASVLNSLCIDESELELETTDQENEAAQISEREEAFAHPAVTPRRQESINRVSHFALPHAEMPRVTMKRVRVSQASEPEQGGYKATAPLAAFLR